MVSKAVVTQVLLLDDLHTRCNIFVDLQLSAVWLPLQNTKLNLLLLLSLFACSLRDNEVRNEAVEFPCWPVSNIRISLQRSSSTVNSIVVWSLDMFF